ncbi:SDR family NAD(P)-dependent oxidoreductase [uncultured Limosilactobacillus sp.]|uniref:SDR family NAD(P)-dependent oxidoreductase n=1 Tax=uncultured Limosilactobacillus sp. TaxID=2837629 RepID=UPI0025E3C38C|nr:SDR family NAD(P)-dependent oxidoreductase [uncultured Limosilactobacillus sp.]
MQIALITGAGRQGNLGFETAKQLGEKGYTVILAARRAVELENLVAELKDSDINASYVVLDVTDEESARQAASVVATKYGKIDILVNNAALMKAGASIEEESIELMKETLDTNVVGAWNVTQKLLPLLKKSDHPRIVNVSSGAGSYDDPDYGLRYGKFGAMGYGISKLALNGLTVKMARDLAPYGILVNSVCPDVTDTYGSGFGRKVADSAKSVIWAAELPDDGPTGGFFRDGKALPW